MKDLVNRKISKINKKTKPNKYTKLKINSKQNDKCSVEACVEIRSNGFQPEDFSFLKDNLDFLDFSQKDHKELNRSFLEAFSDLSLASKEVNYEKSIDRRKTVNEFRKLKSKLGIVRSISSESLKKASQEDKPIKRYKSATKLKLGIHSEASDINENNNYLAKEDQFEEEDVKAEINSVNMICGSSFSSRRRSQRNNQMRLESQDGFPSDTQNQHAYQNHQKPKINKYDKLKRIKEIRSKLGTVNFNDYYRIKQKEKQNRINMFGHAPTTGKSKHNLDGIWDKPLTKRETVHQASANDKGREMEASKKRKRY